MRNCSVKKKFNLGDDIDKYKTLFTGVLTTKTIFLIMSVFVTYVVFFADYFGAGGFYKAKQWSIDGFTIAAFIHLIPLAVAANAYLTENKIYKNKLKEVSSWKHMINIVGKFFSFSWPTLLLIIQYIPFAIIVNDKNNLNYMYCNGILKEFGTAAILLAPIFLYQLYLWNNQQNVLFGEDSFNSNDLYCNMSSKAMFVSLFAVFIAICVPFWVTFFRFKTNDTTVDVKTDQYGRIRCCGDPGGFHPYGISCYDKKKNKTDKEDE